MEHVGTKHANTTQVGTSQPLFPSCDGGTSTVSDASARETHGTSIQPRELRKNCWSCTMHRNARRSVHHCWSAAMQCLSFEIHLWSCPRHKESQVSTTACDPICQYTLFRSTLAVLYACVYHASRCLRLHMCLARTVSSSDVNWDRAQHRRSRPSSR